MYCNDRRASDRGCAYNLRHMEMVVSNANLVRDDQLLTPLTM